MQNFFSKRAYYFRSLLRPNRGVYIPDSWVSCTPVPNLRSGENLVIFRALFRQEERFFFLWPVREKQRGTADGYVINYDYGVTEQRNLHYNFKNFSILGGGYLHLHRDRFCEFQSTILVHKPRKYIPALNYATVFQLHIHKTEVH
jgi:hypothetical protein